MIFELSNTVPVGLETKIVFGAEPEFIPGQVLLIYTDARELAGYFSFYWHDRDTIYLQRLAMTDAKALFAQGVGLGLRKVLVDAFDFLWVNVKFRYLMAAVLNTNTAILMQTLRMGFLIHGIRVSTTGKVFVLLIMQK